MCSTSLSQEHVREDRGVAGAQGIKQALIIALSSQVVIIHKLALKTFFSTFKT